MTIHARNELLSNDLERIVAGSALLWEGLRGKRLFLTGGTGFFGNWLLESFVAANARLELGAAVLILARNRDSLHGLAPHLREHPAITFCFGDVRDFAFPAGEFSHIVHAATTSASATYHGREEPMDKFDTVLGGTRRVLDFAVRCGAEHFLLTSSGMVYGRQPEELERLPEDFSGAPDPTRPEAVVAEAKRAAELLGALYAEKYGVQVKIARCFSFVGPYLPLDLHYAVGNFIADALGGAEIVVKGDGSPLRSYLYAADLVTWLLTILLRGAVCRPYNVGSEQAVSIAELALLVRDTLAPQLPVRIARPLADASPAGRSLYVPATARAREELQLRETIPLAEAIVRTAAFARQTAPGSECVAGD